MTISPYHLNFSHFFFIGVRIRIVQRAENKDTTELSKQENILVRTLDMKRLLKAGIIHTKFFAVDGKNAYIGSANFDWRSLTEVSSTPLYTIRILFETSFFLNLFHFVNPCASGNAHLKLY